MTRLESLLHATAWMKTLREQAGGIPVVMVGTKVDLAEQRVVTAADAAATAREHGMAEVFEASSKTGENDGRVFEAIARLILKTK